MKAYDKVKNSGLQLDKFKDRGIVVQEKLDGSNASFTIENGKLECFSRRKKLNESNTLNGFYEWVHKNISEDDTFIEGYIIFGEWLVKHKVNYKEKYYKNFYVFDVYDKVNEEYLPHKEVLKFADLLSLQTVKTLLVVEPEHFDELKPEHVHQLVGKSDMTEVSNTGEGVVVKFLDGKTDWETYFKLLSTSFKETYRKKMTKEGKNNALIADYAMTKNRMEKMIFRALEEGRLKEDELQLENFSKIIKEVGKDFADDIMIEERDTILSLVEKQIKRNMPHILREVLEERANG